MENITISLSDLQKCSADIRIKNELIYDVLSMIKKEMNSLNNYWMSDSSNMIRDKFNLFSLNFDEIKQVIESYAIYLDQTVTTYDSVENTLTSNASSFK